MTDDHSGFGGHSSSEDDLIEIDLNFESMRRFQAEFSPNLSKDGLFIDTGEPLSPGSVVRFRVILPEEFIFLEGTAVVEWMRGAESASDGVPGMALRFVTLSPQNQELVEQLVQDHVDAGGTAFDFDVRPAPLDYPTDALEGAPPPARESLDEGYRLTLRRSGPNLQAEALQALSEATQDANDEEVSPTTEDEALKREEARGFAILSKTSVALVEEKLDKETGSDAEESDEVEVEVEVEDEVVSDPPALDWSVEMESPVEPTEAPVNVALDFSDAAEDVALDPSDRNDVTDKYPIESTEREPTDPIDESKITDKYPTEVTRDVAPDPSDDSEVTGKYPTDINENAEIDLTDDSGPVVRTPADIGEDTAEEVTVKPVPLIPSEPEEFPTPAEFDSGPEVIEDISSDGFGSPAFNVSLPDLDDEPDTTPVLPDEGRDEVTVHTFDDEAEKPGRRRRLWPLGLVAVFVLAIAGGFLWPRLSAWNESRGSALSQKPASTSVDDPGGLTNVRADEQPNTDSVESTEPSVESTTEPPVVAAEIETSEAVTGADIASEAEIEPEPEPTHPAPAVELARADALTSIEVESGPRGTVITIRGNGSLEDGVISMEPLSSPPRVLIRVRGIQSHYRPYTIESLTPEVTRVRSGLHTERRPPEMWVVVDLTGSEVALDGIDIRRDVAEVILSRP